MHALLMNIHSLDTPTPFTSQCRRQDHEEIVPGRSKRSHNGTAVRLLQAPDQYLEAEIITDELLKWQNQGYQWNQMAGLCRARYPVRLLSTNLGADKLAMGELLA